MCDVTFPPKSWGNCYVTVQDYRRRFADPYYFEFGSGTQTTPKLAKLSPEILKYTYNYNLDYNRVYTNQATKINVKLHKEERRSVSPSCKDLKSCVCRNTLVYSALKNSHISEIIFCPSRASATYNSWLCHWFRGKP